MVLFSNIPYKRMRLTSKLNLTKHFSKKYKSILRYYVSSIHNMHDIKSK